MKSRMHACAASGGGDLDYYEYFVFYNFWHYSRLHRLSRCLRRDVTRVRVWRNRALQPPPKRGYPPPPAPCESTAELPSQSATR